MMSQMLNNASQGGSYTAAPRGAAVGAARAYSGATSVHVPNSREVGRIKIQAPSRTNESRSGDNKPKRDS
jgi:hypothetical protein